MNIQVTQEDIDEGEPRIGNLCPVAKACRRALGCTVFVDNTSVGYSLHEQDFIKDLPKGVVDFIKRFDSGNGTLELKPFEFELED